jgi:hypothetical protein
MARCAVRAGLRRNELDKVCARFNHFRRLTLRSATGLIAAQPTSPANSTYHHYL